MYYFRNQEKLKNVKIKKKEKIKYYVINMLYYRIKFLNYYIKKKKKNIKYLWGI